MSIVAAANEFVRDRAAGACTGASGRYVGRPAMDVDCLFIESMGAACF